MEKLRSLQRITDFNKNVIRAQLFKASKLRSSLMTNSLTVVAKVFSNTLIFFAANAEATHIFFQQKVSIYLPCFKT